MSAMPGRSGGANRKTVEEHRLHGTFRRDRHGSKVVPFSADSWKPSRADLAALDGDGRRFVREWLHTYTVTRAEGAIVLQAAAVYDRLAALRSVDGANISTPEVASRQRLEQGWRKLLAGLLAQLRIAR